MVALKRVHLKKPQDGIPNVALRCVCVCTLVYYSLQSVYWFGSAPVLISVAVD